MTALCQLLSIGFRHTGVLKFEVSQGPDAQRKTATVEMRGAALASRRIRTLFVSTPTFTRQGQAVPASLEHDMAEEAGIRPPGEDIGGRNTGSGLPLKG